MLLRQRRNFGYDGSRVRQVRVAPSRCQHAPRIRRCRRRCRVRGAAPAKDRAYCRPCRCCRTEAATQAARCGGGTEADTAGGPLGRRSPPRLAQRKRRARGRCPAARRRPPRPHSRGRAAAEDPCCSAPTADETAPERHHKNKEGLSRGLSIFTLPYQLHLPLSSL